MLLEFVIPVKIGKFPVPLVVNPTTLPLLPTAVQAYVVPTTPLVHNTAVVANPEQIACPDGLLVTAGVGFIVIKKLLVVPVQPLKVGVTEIVPIIDVFVLLAGAAQGVILPVPLAPKPINALEFTQEKEAPIGLETKSLGLMVNPGQTIIGLNGPTVATG